MQTSFKEAEQTIITLQTENTTLRIQLKDVQEFIDLAPEEKVKSKSEEKENEDESNSSYEGGDEEGPWIKVKTKKKNIKFECKECKFPFQDKSKLKKHMELHSKKKVPHKAAQHCSLCQKQDSE